MSIGWLLVPTLLRGEFREFREHNTELLTNSRADALGTLINKFLDPDIDLSPAGIDNHSMGTVF